MARRSGGGVRGHFLQPPIHLETKVSTGKVNLLNLDRAALAEFFIALGEQRFRAEQMMKWIYHHGERDFSRMTNLSKGLRDRLAVGAELALPEIITAARSRDGTRKWLLEVAPGKRVETVFIPSSNRGTLCLSSQVGCMLDCSFCATGKQGFDGNLSAAAIIGQAYVAELQLSAGMGPGTGAVTNVVFMGMGEPLLNFDNVLTATRLLLDDCSFGLSKRRVTISTAGVVPAIRSLAEVSDVSLAVSLHAAEDELRSQLVPLNRRYPLQELLEACRIYQAVLGDRRKITFEYTLIDGVNDGSRQCRKLIGLLDGMPGKVNLIPFNPFPGSPYRRPPADRIRKFHETLVAAGHDAMVRTTRGDDVNAACGQLVGHFQDRTRRRHKYIATMGGAACGRDRPE